ncbi:MAG: choice-of-anchor J domain-containing protein [Bacteroidota bacterium]|nr:choice-of-anchor J domain-containing protein [Bacteroidota bacterium]
MEKYTFSPSWLEGKIFKRFFLLLVCSTLFLTSLFSQQTILVNPAGDGGFETGTTFISNNWTVVNGTQPNKWFLGTFTQPAGGGARSAYISNTVGGTNNNYTKTASSTVHFYRDVTFPAGETVINLGFTWKTMGDNGYDRLLIYLAPISVTPVVGQPVSPSSTLSGATLISSLNMSSQSSYKNENIVISASQAGNASSASTMRLIFTWQNDNVIIGTDPAGAIDKISLTSLLPGPDVGVSSMLLPSSSACYSSSETVRFRISNYGPALDLSVDQITLSSLTTGQNPVTFTPVLLNSGVLAAGGTIDTVVTYTYNMGNPGVYNFTAYTDISSDYNKINDTLRVSRTVTGSVALPLTVNFSGYTGSNLPTAFSGWYEANGPTSPNPNNALWTSISNKGFSGNVSAYINLYATNRHEWIVGPKFVPTANTLLRYKASVTTSTSLVNPATMGSDDRFDVMISTNCGASWFPIQTLNESSNIPATWSNQAVSLSAYAGQQIIIAFYATDGAINDNKNYNFHLDDINITDVTGYDIGALNLLSPVASRCYSNNESVIVNIKNYGVNAIDFSLNNAIINFNTTGPGAPIPAYTINSGIIPPLDTMAIVVTTAYDMSSNGTYTITANTSLSSDYDNSNNGMPTSTFVATNLNSFPHTENFDAPVPMPVAPGWSIEQISGGGNWEYRTANMIAPNLPPYSSPRYAYFKSSYYNNATSALISPCLSFLYNNTPALEFYMTQSNTYIYNRDSLFVVISTDGGATWTDTIAAISRYKATQTTPAWNKFEYCLSQYGGMMGLKIAFIAKAMYGHDIGLDNITFLQQTSAFAGPVSAGSTFPCRKDSTILELNSFVGTIQWQMSTDNSNFTNIAGATANTHNTGPIMDTTYYRAIVTNAGNACIDRDTSAVIQIDLRPSPVLDITDTIVCGSASYVIDIGPQPAGTSIQWYNGTGGTTRTVSTSGTYWVKAESIYLCSDSVSINVTFATPIIANAGLDITICEEDTVPLTATGGVDYLWSTNQTSASILVYPSVNTTYNVEVTGANGCKDVDSVTVYVEPKPVVNLGNDSISCSPVFLNAGNPGSTYNWQDGSTNSTLTAASSGYFWVDVSNSGCVARDSVLITISPTPVVNLGNDSALCGTLILDAGNAGSTYNWNTAETTQTINADTSGTYRVVVTTPDGCTNADTIIVYVTPAPLSNLAQNISTCDNSYILNAANTGSTYLWSNSLTSQTITATTSGLYWVDITNFYGCTIRDSVNLSMSSNPPVNLGPDKLQCGGSVLLNAGPGYTSYNWSNGATTQSISVSTSGSYIINVIDNNSCSNSDTILVNIFPKAVINAGIDRTVCQNQSLTLSATGGVSYLWNPGGATGSSITVNPSANTPYVVTGTNSNGCSANDTVIVAISPSPIASFTSAISGTTLTTDNLSSNSTIYYWSFGDGNSSSQFNPTHTYINDGNYTIMLIAVNNCGTDTSYQQISTAGVGIDEVADAYNLNVFPNPSNGQFTVHFDNPVSQKLEIRIMNMNGTIVFNESINYFDGKYNKNIDISHMSGGMYFMQLITEDRILNRKLILNK